MQKQAMASSNFLLLSLALLLIALSFVPNFTSASLEEANALQKWKATLKIPNNSQIVSSWTPLPTNTSSPAPCPSWFGIACNADGNVNRLNLSTSELKGTLHQFPFSIQGNLTHFNLSVNSFFGPIPPEIGLLSKLVHLDFSTNQFSGVIPPTIGKLSQLAVLHFFTNQLSGPIPIELGNMKSLKELELYENQLNGSIPSSLGNLKSLNLLYLYRNQLSGPIPIELGNLKNLTDLDLSENQLNGSIPSSLGDLKSLNFLYLHKNQLSGPIPIELGNMKSLTEISLGKNQLSGSIPSSLGDLKSLNTLYLQKNQLSGPIPIELGNLKNLSALELANNQLNGSIPSSLGDSIQVLDLSSNHLAGRIPYEFEEMKSLLKLNLSDNNLSGAIPQELGSLYGLLTLDLSTNRLNGSLPKYIGEWVQINHLNLSNNKLSGGITWEIGKLSQLNVLDLSWNSLAKEIPPVVGILLSLVMMNLSHNKLSGSIPNAFSIFPGRIDIDLSYNELTGPVPPGAVFQNVSGEAFQGNDGLCGNVAGLKLCKSRNNHCDNYGLCGPYGICSISTTPNCVCLKGFELKIPQELYPWASGCQRSRTLDCGPEEGFLKFSNLKLPDTQNAIYDTYMNLQECEVACKRDCSCTAYAIPNITEGGVGCLQWFGDLVDVRVYPQNWQDLYVRLAASELSDLHSSYDRKKRVVIEVSLSISTGLILLGLLFTLYTWSKRKKRSDAEREGRNVTILDRVHKGSSQKGSIDVPFYSLSKVSRATDNFSADNKLGEGGFGPVYKGVLEGEEIAVKRLSKSSRQGLDEFENEVICIAKLQHRNLVKLLGYCIEGDERMLLYEYMPNKSLDSFIFDGVRKSLLDWPQRFHIINGVARGLLYLHQDSRLKVVHRDLKAGNILLNHQMLPKISDFGLARMFKEHESEANTKRIVGTLGYISPEYAVNGHFSVKSDIFSFGVLVLEIVSGKKNRGFVHEKHNDHLLEHAWRLCKEGKSLDLIDECLGNSYSVSEVLRSVHVGLLCVQQRAEDRPCTPSVVAMLGGEGSLPSPKQPGFFIQGSEIYSTSRLHSLSSVNGVTLTQIDGR